MVLVAQDPEASARIADGSWGSHDMLLAIASLVCLVWIAALLTWAFIIWVRMFKLPWVKSVAMVALLGGPYIVFASASGLSDRVSYLGLSASVNDLIKAVGT